MSNHPLPSSNAQHTMAEPPPTHPHTTTAQVAPHMTDEPRPLTGPLTDAQRARIDFAHRDLDRARSEDLGALDHAALIMLVEVLRRRLDDTLQLVDEITTPEP